MKLEMVWGWYAYNLLSLGLIHIDANSSQKEKALIEVKDKASLYFALKQRIFLLTFLNPKEISIFLDIFK